MRTPLENTGFSESFDSQSPTQRSQGDWNSVGEDWEWPIVTGGVGHEDRLPLMRPIPYTLSVTRAQGAGGEAEPSIECRESTALSLNVSSGGLLLMMDDDPERGSVLKVGMPSPVDGPAIPTLVEVCWSRQLPFPIPPALHLVGVKFLI